MGSTVLGCFSDRLGLAGQMGLQIAGLRQPTNRRLVSVVC